MSETPETPAPPAKKGSAKWIVIAVLFLLLASGGAAGAYWWTHRAPAAAHQPSEAEEAMSEHAGIVPLEPFVVNLSDAASSRYLRTTLRLVIADGEKAKEIAEHEVSVMRLRSAILEFLAQQTSDQLVTPEGKAALKKGIAKRGSEILRDTKVVDVLFSDFVVQF